MKLTIKIFIFTLILSFNSLFSNQLIKAVKENNLELVKKISNVQKKEYITIFEKDLVGSYFEHLPEALKAALENNYNYNYILNEEENILIQEELNKNKEIIKILLESSNKVTEYVLRLALDSSYLSQDYYIISLLIKENAHIPIPKNVEKEINLYGNNVVPCHIEFKILKKETIYRKKTFLTWAIEKNDFAATKLLLENKATFSKYDFKKALINSNLTKNYNIVKLLIQYGANVNDFFYENKKDHTNKKDFLYWSIQMNNYELTKILLENGAYLQATYKGHEIKRSHYTGQTMPFPMKRDIWFLHMSEEIKELVLSYK
jgi:hypothetical protein